eukprot:scaffold7576_cov417-Prasinococcus_capsulatus_cf.AAC.5
MHCCRPVAVQRRSAHLTCGSRGRARLPCDSGSKERLRSPSLPTLRPSHRRVTMATAMAMPMAAGWVVRRCAARQRQQPQREVQAAAQGRPPPRFSSGQSRVSKSRPDYAIRPIAVALHSPDSALSEGVRMGLRELGARRRASGKRATSAIAWSFGRRRLEMAPTAPLPCCSRRATHGAT